MAALYTSMAKRWKKNTNQPAAVPASSASPAVRAAIPPWRDWLPQALLIIAAGLWVYWPALNGGWLWDDDHYITDNNLMDDPLGFWKVWVHRGGLRDYCPLVSSVQWIQWQLWGKSTVGYHLTNLVLHLGSAFLFWRVLARIGLPLAWLGGLIFTVHPINIESVAWISELKNTLSLPLLLLAILTWLAWDKDRDPRLYIWSVLLFLFSLLAKPTGMMVPLILLAHAWATRGKIDSRDLKSTALFFAAALVLGLVALAPPPLPPGAGGIHPAWNIISAFVTTGWTLFFMLGKCLVPVNLMPVYPSLAVYSPTAFDFLPWLALAVFAALLLRGRAGWGRVLLFGFGFFLINLAPVLGFTFVHYNEMVWSLDHLSYIPILGLIASIVAALGYLEARLPSARAIVRPLVAAWLIAMAWGAHSYAGWYASWESLWTNELRVQPASRIALLNVASIYVDRNDFATALPYVTEALRLQPDDSDARYDMGLTLFNLGHKTEAEQQYRELLRQDPTYAKGYVSLAGMVHKAGDDAQAEALYRQGLQHNPDDPSLCINLGGLLQKQGRTAEVIDLYERALESSPDLAQLHYNLGLAFLGQGKLPDAAEHLQIAVRLEPKLVAAHENLGVALAQLSRLPEAIEQFQAVIQLDPKSVAARNNLALALVQTGQVSEAIDQLQQVLQIDPTDARAKESLAKLQQYQLKQGAPGR